MPGEHIKDMRLWAAVIERAVADVRGQADMERRTAIAWITADTRVTYSFNWACDVVGLGEPAKQKIRAMCQ